MFKIEVEEHQKLTVFHSIVFFHLVERSFSWKLFSVARKNVIRSYLGISSMSTFFNSKLFSYKVHHFNYPFDEIFWTTFRKLENCNFKN